MNVKTKSTQSRNTCLLTNFILNYIHRTLGCGLTLSTSRTANNTQEPCCSVGNICVELDCDGAGAGEGAGDGGAGILTIVIITIMTRAANELGGGPSPSIDLNPVVPNPGAIRVTLNIQTVKGEGDWLSIG